MGKRPRNLLRDYEKKVRSWTSLSNNFDERGGVPASPKATGHYLAYLDNLAEVSANDQPELTKSGGIRVNFYTNTDSKTGAFVIFEHNSSMTLGAIINGKESSNTFDWDLDRLLDFVFAARNR